MVNTLVSRKDISEELKRGLFLSFCVTFILGMFSYGYVFMNFVPAHDGMMVYTRDQYWQMSIGRYLMLYYVKLRGPLDAPWLIGILSLIYISLAVFLCLKLLKIEFDLWKITVVSSLFTLNIAFIATAATYIYLFDIFALALVLSVFAIYLFDRYDNPLGFVISSLFLALSMGAYQSYFAVAIGLHMLLAIKELLDGKESKKVIVNGLFRILNLILAGVFYFVFLKISLAINGVNAYKDSYNSVSNIQNLSLFGIIRLIPNSYICLFKNLFNSYTYSTRVVDAISLLIVLIGAFLLVIAGIYNCKGTKEKVFFGILVILYPLGISSVYILANGLMHQLMMFSYQMIFLLGLYPVLSDKVAADTTKIRTICYRLMLFLVAANSFLIIRFSNDVFYYKKLVGEGTTAAITNMVYDIERNIEFDKNSTEIVFVGNASISLQSDYEMRYVLGNTAGVTTLGTTITYNDVLKWYLEGTLGKDYIFVQDGDIEEKIKSLDVVKSMPEYPHEGYCKIVDGYMVIKFAE